VTPEVDKVLCGDDPVPWIEHVEIQAGRDTRLGKSAFICGRSTRMPNRAFEATAFIPPKMAIGLMPARP
jgi:hypothetical protein